MNNIPVVVFWRWFSALWPWSVPRPNLKGLLCKSNNDTGLFVAALALIVLSGALAQQSDQSQAANNTDGRVVAPIVIRDAEPEYSAEAQAKRIEGTVVVRLVVGEDGAPRNLAISKSVGYGLDAKALECVAKWKFTPGMRNGKPVPVQAVIEVTFKFAKATGQAEACQPPQSNEAPDVGVVVEKVAPIYEHAFKPVLGGDPPLCEGDLIISWRRGAERGNLNSPFDWYEMVTEQLPRGPITLIGSRGTSDSEWTLRASTLPLTTWRSFPLGALPSTKSWEETLPPRIIVRPPLRSGVLDIYHRCQALERKEDSYDLARGNAARCWREMLRSLRFEDPEALGLWARFELARSLAATDSWNDANREYAIATDAAEHANHVDTSICAQLLEAWGDSELRRNSFSLARGLYERALALRKEIRPASFAVARDLNNLASVAARSETFGEAKDLYDAAARIQSDLAPGGIDLAMSLYGKGEVYMREQDLETAKTILTLALAAAQRNDSSHTTSLMNFPILMNLYWIERAQGHLKNAKGYLTRAVETVSFDRSGRIFRYADDELGALDVDLGNLANIEASTLRILAADHSYYDQIGASSRYNHNLGSIEMVRGHLDKADDYFRKALTVARTVQQTPSLLSPGYRNSGGSEMNLADLKSVSFEVISQALFDMGVLSKQRGTLVEAETYLKEAVEIGYPSRFYGVLNRASALSELGDVLRRTGNFGRAEKYLDQAEELIETENASGESGGTDLLAVATYYRGRVAFDRDDIDRASLEFTRALKLSEHYDAGFRGIDYFTGRLDTAEARYFLARTYLARGRADEATKLLASALDQIESRVGESGFGSTQSVRATFRAKHAAFYKAYEEALIETKQPERAFQVTERSRARSLLEMMTERDLVFSTDVGPELAQARKANALAYDEAETALLQGDPLRDRERVELAITQLQKLTEEREQLRERVKKASPRIAALQYPQALDLTAARATLDPGTTLLTYSVDDYGTVLFAVRPSGAAPGLSVVDIPISRKDLEARIGQFRSLIEQHRGTSDKEFAAKARELYDLLVKPAEPSMISAERVLVVGDGPLLSLPFAALMRSEKQYLIEWKPLHTVVSLTVYDELKKQRKVDHKSAEMVAFGDPVYPPAGSGEDHQALRGSDLSDERSFALNRLPFSRQEVDGIATLFPQHSQIYLGANATEERAKSLGRDVRYIHFAVHGLLDDRVPLNSALALTIPKKMESGGENGLLQAWEIFDQMRIDADLVTLSACDTGLGTELSGEGLIGLTRAFQYAGARSVLASLWSVDDFQTMRLMTDFYRRLNAGAGKDEAMRQAQITLLRTKASSSPYYWAAFSLIGDWR